MSSIIRNKRSSSPGIAPTTDKLDSGEIAINTHDGKMFFRREKDGTLSIREVGLADRALNVLYVSKSGSDTDSNGTTIAEAFASLNKALEVATPGTTIFLKSGDHYLDNDTGGVVIPTFVSIVGDNLRTTSIYPTTATNDLFYVNNGSHITGVTFRGYEAPAAAVSFPPDSSAGEIITSPYVQNCSSITSTGTGMRIDGSLVTGLRSMVADAFTQINAGGIGIHLINRGYAQLVSIFTVSCTDGILCESGGMCSLTNSNCSFGIRGLRATGTSEVLYTGTTVGTALSTTSTIVMSNLTERPKYGDAIKIQGKDQYLTVEDCTELVSGEATVTILESLDFEVEDGLTVEFLQRSLIAASSITFEYVGTGTNLYDTPRSGAFPVQENEVVFDDNNAGVVYFTSTDHKGDFRIGSDLLINRDAGIIEGVTFDRSLFAVLTPYILAIEG